MDDHNSCDIIYSLNLSLPMFPRRHVGKSFWVSIASYHSEKTLFEFLMYRGWKAKSILRREFGSRWAATDAESVNEVSPRGWTEVPGNGWSLHFNSAEQSDTFEGRVISVKWGNKTKKIGIDGTAEAIKEAIKSSFMLRTKHPFWLEDENMIVRAVDRDMPLRNYTLHVDEGLTIKVSMSEDADDLSVQTEDQTFYSEDDFYDFLSHRGWTRLRKNNGYQNIDRMDELCPGAVYHGVN